MRKRPNPYRSLARLIPLAVWSLIAVGLWSICGTNQSFADDVHRSEPDILKDVKENYGLLIELPANSLFQRELMRRFARLAQAQERLIKDDVVAMQKFYVIDNPEATAFIIFPREPGIRLAAQYIFISTGMIHRMMPLDSDHLKLRAQMAGESTTDMARLKEREIYEGLRGIEGLAVHELAHPMDGITVGRGGVSIRDNWNDIGAQAIEIRADVEGSLIAREAHIPPSVVLIAQQRYLAGGARRVTGVFDFVESHPQWDFRLASMRMYLTLDRLKNGEYELAEDPPFSTEEMVQLIAEVEKLGGHYRGRHPWTPPKSLDEIVKRLEAIYKESLRDRNQNHDYLRIEANRLLLASDQKLAEIESAGRELSAGEKTAFSKMLRLIVKLMFTYNSHEIPYNQDEIHRILTVESGSAAFFQSPCHTHYVDRLKVYRDPQVLAEMQNIIEYEAGTLVHERIKVGKISISVESRRERQLIS